MRPYQHSTADDTSAAQASTNLRDENLLCMIFECVIHQHQRQEYPGDPLDYVASFFNQSESCLALAHDVQNFSSV